MSGKWIYVTGYSANWSGTSLYINPELRAAKIIQSEFYGFYDDEGYPEYDETETFISIEKALEMVYPNEEKITFITNHIPGDYTGILKKLKERGA